MRDLGWMRGQFQKIMLYGPSMMQFVSLHSSTTPHNTHVKSKRIKEIVETPGCTYSEVEVTSIYYNNI